MIMKYLLILFLILFSFNVSSQKINFVYKEMQHSGSRINRIQFIDTLTFDTLKVLELNSDNPFLKLFNKNDSIINHKWETLIWINSKKSLQDYIYIIGKSYLRESNDNSIDYISLSPAYVIKGDKMCGTYYNAAFYNKNYLLGSMSIIIVFDTKGIILIDDKSNYSISNAIFSNNGSHLCITYEINDENGNLFIPFYSIFDIKRSQRIVSEVFSENSKNSSVAICDANYVVFSAKISYQLSQNVVFDNDKLSLYTIEIENFYSNNQYYKIRPDGYYFYDGKTKNEIRRLLFQEDFEIKKILQ